MNTYTTTVPPLCTQLHFESWIKNRPGNNRTSQLVHRQMYLCHSPRKLTVSEIKLKRELFDTRFLCTQCISRLVCTFLRLWLKKTDKLVFALHDHAQLSTCYFSSTTVQNDISRVFDPCIFLSKPLRKLIKIIGESYKYR